MRGLELVSTMRPLILPAGEALRVSFDGIRPEPCLHSLARRLFVRVYPRKPKSKIPCGGRVVMGAAALNRPRSVASPCLRLDYFPFASARIRFSLSSPFAPHPVASSGTTGRNFT